MKLQATVVFSGGTPETPKEIERLLQTAPDALWILWGPWRLIPPRPGLPGIHAIGRVCASSRPWEDIELASAGHVLLVTARRLSLPEGVSVTSAAVEVHSNDGDIVARVTAFESRLYAAGLDRNVGVDLFKLADDAWFSEEGRRAMMDLVDRLRVADALQLPPDTGTDTSDGPILSRSGKIANVLCLVAAMIPYRDAYPEWRGWHSLTQRAHKALAAHGGQGAADAVMSGLM